MVTVKIEGQLTIDDNAAELLHAMSSSRLTRAMYRALPLEITRRMSLEQVQIALNAIHCQTAGVLRQRHAALHAIQCNCGLQPSWPASLSVGS
jgi:hypothetical protein